MAEDAEDDNLYEITATSPAHEMTDRNGAFPASLASSSEDRWAHDQRSAGTTHLLATDRTLLNETATETISPFSPPRGERSASHGGSVLYSAESVNGKRQSPIKTSDLALHDPVGASDGPPVSGGVRDLMEYSTGFTVRQAENLRIRE
jgi:hypothetical protein